jgi:cytochrome c553
MNRLYRKNKSMIKLSLLLAILGFSTISASSVMAAGDPVRGKTLHDAKCFACHDTHQYTRKNRIIHTYDDLLARVKFCDSAAKAGFSSQDIQDVVAYLNKEFYKFKPE